MTTTDQPTIDQALAAGQAEADRILQLGRTKLDAVDRMAEQAYGDDEAYDDIESRVFSLLVDVATRYAEMTGTRRITDVTHPLAENLEMTLPGLDLLPPEAAFEA